VAPVEPWKKVLVDRAFLETDHGEISCRNCHKGDETASDMADAHKELTPDPTYPDATTACAECHEDISEPAKVSLHYTLATYKPMIHARSSQNPAVRAKISAAMENHCYTCHSSCGQCHVSRPNSVDGGLVAGHKFIKKPSMTEQCTACHGSRIGNEYLGKTGLGDVHYTRKSMDCMACHGAEEIHGDGKTGHRDRYQAAGLPACKDCHPSDGGIEQHTIHGDTIQCQVCHSQPYANCFACHVGKDSKGLVYFKNLKEAETLKIGLNPYRDKDRPYKWVLLRRVPVAPETFGYYVKDAMTNFDALPTWKYTSPHNIQRRTSRNRKCDNCHWNTRLFLTEKDVERPKANSKVLVPADQIPKQIGKPGEKKKKKRKGYF